MYTCRILVCHPTVRESDLKNVMSPEENRTIAHSPPPTTGNVYSGYISAVPFVMFLDDLVFEKKTKKKTDCPFLFYI